MRPPSEAIVANTEEITTALVQFVLSEYPSKYFADTLPRDQSLLELGVLDSAGVIELLVFVESTWKIEISDEDITKERAGSLNKMAALVQEYIARKS
jgi:acyl carrier protein